MSFYRTLARLDRKFPNCQKTFFKIIFWNISIYLKIRMKLFGPRKSVLFAGQAYYNAWYLSRELRVLGWRADVLNWDTSPSSQIYYHGEDFKIKTGPQSSAYDDLIFYLKALLKYDIFHFSNTNGIHFGYRLAQWFQFRFGDSFEIYLLKSLRKKIVYSNNGCLDGVSQTSFAKWGPESVCSICRWQNEPNVCNDQKNLKWGSFRNTVADYQCLFGGNRVDSNDDPKVHEVPEFYCLNADVWRPDIEIPNNFKLKRQSKNTLFFYHAVGNKKERTNDAGVNIKSTHVYLPLIEQLKEEGFDIEIISPEGIPNKDVRYYQAQADIVLEMLTYGWYGANAREAMMLGKPVVCYLRPEWIESLRKELPECAEELPIVCATPHNVYTVIKDLMENPEKRVEIGRRSREFALKWHSDTVAAKRFDEIYTRLLNDN